MRIPFASLFVLITIPTIHLSAQEPTAEQAGEIAGRLERLGEFVNELGELGVDGDVLTDVAVFAKAADRVRRLGEYPEPKSVDRTLSVIDRGLLRASQAGRGQQPWMYRFGSGVIHGFRSRVDGSIQPYAVTFPRNYARPTEGNRWRLDVVLHGRDDRLTEVKFLHAHDGAVAPEGQDFVTLEVFGRGNNAYRWAGETDVFEAIEHFLSGEAKYGRGGWIDPGRVVLRGFSMGGAGTWHIGLHHPDQWCVLGPGAGFTTTHGYVAGLPEQLPPHQEKCLRIYDAVPYAANVAAVPVVAYAGSEDRQLQAARNIEAALEGTKQSIKLLVAPGLGHQFPPEWKAKADAEYQKVAGPGMGREPFPDRVRFVTYTLKYPKCDWVEILGLERHYERASVDAARMNGELTIRTQNVSAIRVAMPPEILFPESVTIDGQEVSTRFFAASFSRVVHFVKTGGRWRAVMGQRWVSEQFRTPRKTPGLQGPIDDAFTQGFLCVRGSGEAWNPDVVRAADARLDRFWDDWDKHMHGELLIKRDVEVTDADISQLNLILFGDPGSNALIAEIRDRLPLTWDRDALTLGRERYDAATHMPVLICPNPLNPTKYVVINTGHTFGDADFKGTNALLYPRLGDYAILKVNADAAEPVHAGLFDEDWGVPNEEE